MKRYDELINNLYDIEKLGFIKTHRNGNTGIGKTLEDLLSIKENNFEGPNGHQTELKSTRKESDTLLTLFTKTPSPPKINRKLLEKFGYSNEKGKILHTTINGISKNTLRGKEGFKININRDRIEIFHSDYGYIPTPYWKKEVLEDKFNFKFQKNLLYVKADSRGKGKNEEFHYNEAWLLFGFSFENFIKLVKEGHILVDIRIGQYKDGRSHDHGTGFRLSKNKLDLLFKNRKKVL